MVPAIAPRTVVLIAMPVLLSPLLFNHGGLDSGNMPQSAVRMAGCVVLLATYWASEALPLPVTALMPLLLFPTLGIRGNKDVAVNYFKDTNVLFIGSLMMAAAIEASGLHKRMALKVMMVVGTEGRFGMHGMAFLMLGAMGASWFLSMWISNTASTAMLIPVVRSLVQVIKDDVKADRQLGGGAGGDKALPGHPEPQLGESRSPSPAPGVAMQVPAGEGLGESLGGGAAASDAPPPAADGDGEDNPALTKYSKGLLISVAYASSIGGIATLTGTPTNLVFTGFIEDNYARSPAFNDDGSGGPVSFVKWMTFALPLSVSPKVT